MNIRTSPSTEAERLVGASTTLSSGARSFVRAAYHLARFLRHKFRPQLSYAADSEDVAAARLLGTVSRYIDVGANYPTSLSNTTLFALRGASGLCFEPNPTDYARLKSFFRIASRVECIGEGLSDRSSTVELRADGLLSAMTETEDAGLTNLLQPYFQKHAAMVMVAVETLSTWLERRPQFVTSDLLSIDVEGHELNVLRGIDWQRHQKPARCFVIETHSAGDGREWLHRDYAAIDDLLSGRGYRKIAASANNTFWLHHSDVESSRVDQTRAALPHYKWF